MIIRMPKRLLFFALAFCLAYPCALAATAWPWIPQLPWHSLPWHRHKGGGGVSKRTYDDLDRFTKYASAVYTPMCPRPLGNKLVVEVRGQRVLLRHGLMRLG
jgi:hypothetical protein